MKQIPFKSKKPVFSTTLPPKDEALRACELYFSRFSNVTFRPPTIGETATQYRTYMIARLQPMLDNAQAIKNLVSKASAHG